MKYIINATPMIKQFITNIKLECIFIEHTEITEETASSVFNGNNLILSVGRYSYDRLKYLNELKVLHFGLRNFDYGSIVLLKYLNLGNCLVVFIQDGMDHPQFKPNLLNFCKLTESEIIKIKLPNYKIYYMDEILDNKIILDKFRGIRTGLDYESRGFPSEHYYETVGVGLATLNDAIYVDMRYYKHESHLIEFRKLLGDLLFENYNNMWVYNVSFEYYATYREFKKYCYFNDVMALVKCDDMFGSLKYVAQYYLGVSSWDDSLDIYFNKLNTLFKIENTYEKAMAIIDEEVKAENYTNYSLLQNLYKLGVDDNMLRKYWWGEFGCMPVNVNGRYCCYDSYYTLLLSNVLGEIYE